MAEYLKDPKARVPGRQDGLCRPEAAGAARRHDRLSQEGDAVDASCVGGSRDRDAGDAGLGPGAAGARRLGCAAARGSAIRTGTRRVGTTTTRSPIPTRRRLHGSEIVIKEVTGDPAKGQQLAFDRSRGGGCLACHVMGPKTLEIAGQCRARPVGDRQGRPHRPVALQLRLRCARLQSEVGDAAVGQARLLQRGRDQRHRRLPQDAEDAGQVRRSARRSREAPEAGRGSRCARSLRQSGRRTHRGRCGAVQEVLRLLPRHARRRPSSAGRSRCRNGSRGSTRCWVRRSSSPATPRRRPARTG